MMRPTRRTSRRLWQVAVVTSVALLAGCDGQNDTGATLRDFVIDFARSALAAFLL